MPDPNSALPIRRMITGSELAAPPSRRMHDALGSIVGEEAKFGCPGPIRPSLANRLGMSQIGILSEIGAGSTNLRQFPIRKTVSTMLRLTADSMPSPRRLGPDILITTEASELAMAKWGAMPMWQRMPFINLAARGQANELEEAPVAEEDEYAEEEQEQEEEDEDLCACV